MFSSNAVPDNDIENKDFIEYAAVVFARLLAEPMGLALVLFLAVLFMVPSQIPDMIDPYFQWANLGWPAIAYTALAGWMGYTVWFWMVAAIRSEALIPGGRYYMPYGAKERGYVRVFGSERNPWHRPFNYAANFAALFAFLACMSRPIFLLLDWATGSIWGFIPAACVIWIIWAGLYWIAFGGLSEKLTQVLATAFGGLYLFGYLLVGVGAIVFLVIIVTAIVGAFALVAIFDKRISKSDSDTDFALTFKRRDLTSVNRFSGLWSCRATAMLLASPHRFFWQKGDSKIKSLARSAMWVLHVFGPAVFLLYLFHREITNQIIGFPTPVAALLSLSMSVGPLVMFLAIMRDACEHVMILLVRKEDRNVLIEKHRGHMRSLFKERLEHLSEEEKERVLKEKDPGIERIAYGTYRLPKTADGRQRVNAATRIFARAGALILMGMLYFTNTVDNLYAKYPWASARNDTTANDYTPSNLSYHIAGASAKDAHVIVHRRDKLHDALVNWKDKRRNLVAHSVDGSDVPEVPVVIVSAYGGANRAAVWSMSMLHKLDANVTSGRLNPHIFAFSGVSGGALGSITYAFQVERSLKPDVETPDWPLPVAARFDLLAPAISYFFNVDLLKRFDVAPLRFAFSDRNEILERSFAKGWEKFWNFRDMHSTGLLAAHRNSDGRMPHLLLNGVDSRSGRRILTSTLQIAEDMFPDTQDFFNRFGRDILPATAVMNSARFPLISPSGRYIALTEPCKEVFGSGIVCPPEMHHQIIDGGYYENSGVQTAYELAQAIEEIADGFAKTHDWRPVPVILSISNQASGVISDMIGTEKLKKLTMDNVTVFRSLRGQYFPEFSAVTTTCDQRAPVPELFSPDAEEFSTELGSIIKGVLNTASSHNHRSLRLAMEDFCGSDTGKRLAEKRRFLHFGLPRPVKANQSAPMNWVLSPAAADYLTMQAPEAVVATQTQEVNALRNLLMPASE